MLVSVSQSAPRVPLPSLSVAAGWHNADLAFWAASVINMIFFPFNYRTLKPERIIMIVS